jgi:hypothetical protein
MKHRNDHKKQKLLADLGRTDGNISDLGYDWLIQQGVQAGHINGMWAEYNALQGAPGHINDGFFQWLGDLLHLGALPDRWRDFWSSP